MDLTRTVIGDIDDEISAIQSQIENGGELDLPDKLRAQHLQVAE
ncbi:hypothetical protein ACMAZF_03945 [Psychrobium sp. nBUS_13]